MCYKWPGPRCSAYALKELKTANRNFMLNASQENFNLVKEAEAKYDTTPQGQKDLRYMIDELGDEDGLFSARLEHGIAARKMALNDLKMADAGDVGEGAHQGPMAAPEAPQALDIEDVAQDITKKYVGVTLIVSQRENIVTISLISVTKTGDARGQGSARKTMEELCTHADTNNIALALSPSDDFGSSKARLVKWYSSMGFVPNTGRTRDFASMETMIRRPIS